MSETKRRGQFTFYASYFDAVLDLPASKQWQTMKALIEYALDGRVSEELQGCARAVFKAFKPNLDSARVKAEQARRKGREAGEEVFSEPGPEACSEPWAEAEAPARDETEEPEDSAADHAAAPPAGQSKKEDKSKNKDKNKDKNKIDSEKERKQEAEQKNEGSAGPEQPGVCGQPAAAGASPGLSLSDREKQKMLSQTPLIGRPPYADMFRQDPLLIYYWRDLAQPEQGRGPMPESEQRRLLSELLPLPPWARPAHLTDRLRAEN